MDAHEVLETLPDRLARRMEEGNALLRIDQAIDADPYDDIVRLKELLRVQ
jgi:hypothetical protein